MKAADIRRVFLDYFKKNEHQVVESSPLVPQNDPTLLFTNAGMVQFKDYFTGADVPPYPRAATSQKCIRAGGKHNDLENVGYTARHHTFFEMLGNFSFGNYFKEEAIHHAWTLITKEYGLSPEKLLVTVYHEDEEAASLWKKIAGFNDDKIIRIATKDNFWAMGDTGPCGPCTEIFYDHGEGIFGGPPGSADQDGDRFIEIWNLVFMQFEQLKQTDGSTKMIPLPKPSIDTGMGLERITAVMQGKHNNYDIDLFQDIINTSKAITGNDDPSLIAAHRVIADHLRSSCFLIADGVLPSSEGRGYVLRRIMRRAMRQVHKLGYKDLLMHQMVPILAKVMGEAYPDLVRAQPIITETLRLEEERFQRTLDRGMSILTEESLSVSAGGALPGGVAFKLYDTYGFPLDLTQDIMRGEGKSVDVDAFTSEMEKQKELARSSWVGSGDSKVDPIWFEIQQEIGASEFLGYTVADAEGQLQAIVQDGNSIETATVGSTVAFVCNQTPFYAESGGQMGDVGVITTSGAEFRVTDTQKRANGLFVHFGQVTKGEFKVGDAVHLKVNNQHRFNLRAHHSATHLLHKALQLTLGNHVMQKGSLVAADRLRFDFSHMKAVTREELQKIEDTVNHYIRQNKPVQTRVTTPEIAKAEGAMALFGEKYGESVRVVSMGFDEAEKRTYSTELCGGIHVAATGDIGSFKSIAESSVASGVRRIEAVVGIEAEKFIREEESILRSLADHLKCSPAALFDKVEGLSQKIKQLEKDLKSKASASPGAKADIRQLKDSGSLAVQVVDHTNVSELRSISDELKTQIQSGVVVVFGKEADKVSIIVSVTQDKTTMYDAVAIARELSVILGGKGGGGRPDFAQAGGSDPSKIDVAIASLSAL
ncbi:MAG: alanine--tRNA ligase [Alphaproteobacteria bacterium]|nr:alanine--tRNA ligase [Alphaproteobacteria bacterium]